MTNEMREILNKVWTNNANKQTSLSTVIKTSCDALRTDKMGAGAYFADMIGDGSKHKEQRTKFINALMRRLNWVRYANEEKITVIELVKVSASDLDKYTSVFAEYHIIDKDVVKVENCTNHIDVEEEVEVMVTFTHESGFKEQRPKRDADGNKITKKGIVTYVPREKAHWGYTNDVKQAFFGALEDMENEAK